MGGRPFELLRAVGRYAGLLADWHRLGPGIDRPIHLCVSADFDLLGDMAPPTGYDVLERLFARHGLTGRVTYLINPAFDLGADHPVYRRIWEDGNEIGQHTHAEELIFQDREEELRALMTSHKETIERTFRRFDSGFAVRSFRSGSRAFSPTLFRELMRLGIRYDSTMGHLLRRRRWFQYAMEDGVERRRAYYLEPETFRVEAPGPTALVELPVTSQIPELRALTAALRPGEPLILSTFIHPCNVFRHGRRRQGFLRFYDLVLGRLAWLTRRNGRARFSHLSEAGAAWEAWRAAASL
jgi:peptidoglycan/xylan/chitin deacetylase (PgdA/CDA1 family)